MPFLPPNQQRQSNEGEYMVDYHFLIFKNYLCAVAAQFCQSLTEQCMVCNFHEDVSKTTAATTAFYNQPFQEFIMLG